jgi:hypothetical protein
MFHVFNCFGIFSVSAYELIVLESFQLVLISPVKIPVLVVNANTPYM